MPGLLDFLVGSQPPQPNPGGLLGGLRDALAQFSNPEVYMQQQILKAQAQANAQAGGMLGGDVPADMPAPQAPMQSSPALGIPQMPTTAGGPEPRGIRNNNPTNIEAGPFTQSQPGFAGSDGRFARFQAPDQGLDAAGKLIDIYRDKHGLNTVAGIVGRWAPASADNNPTNNYAAAVARQLGVDPNQPIDTSNPDVKHRLVMAMGQFENGRPIGGGQAQALAPPAAPMAMPGPMATPPAAVPQGEAPQNLAQAVPAPAPAAPLPPANPTNPNQAQINKILQLMTNPNLGKGAQEALKLRVETLQKSSDPTGTIKEYQFARQQGYKGSFEDWTSESEKRKQNQVTVNSFANPLVKGLSDQFIADRDKARASADDVRAIHAAREQVDQGIISGAGANEKLWLAKLGTAFGLPNDKIASTETFKAAMGSRVLAIVTGLGAGAGISNADRDFAAEMAGGRIALDEASIRRILDIGERGARARIKLYNEQADKFGKQLPDDAKAYGALMGVDAPGEYVKPQRATNPQTDPLGIR